MRGRRCWKALRAGLVALALLTATAWAQDYLRTASQLYQKRDFLGAADNFEKYLRSKPGDAQARMMLGVCRQQSGDFNAAAAAFQRVADHQPKNTEARFFLALAQFSSGRYDEAGTNARSAIQLGGATAPAHHLLGMVLEELNDPEQALAQYETALRADETLIDADLSAGNVLLKLGRPVEGLDHFRAVVRRNPSLAEAHYHLARAQADLGQWTEAESSLEKTLQLRDHPQARSLLARVRSGELTAAAQPKSAADRVPEIRFRNVARQAGLDFVLANHPTPQKFLVETMAGGVAAFDYDGDGRTDIFFTNGAETPSLAKRGAKYSNRLYRNLGGMRFRDVTAQAGLGGEGFSIGAAAADYDNDGDADLFVAGVRGNHLYRNNGDGTFEDVTAQAGVAGGEWSVAAGWLDYDRDGLLDLFVVNYLDWSPSLDRYCGDNEAKVRTYCHPKYFQGLPNRLYRNLGDGRFEDVSESSGIAAHIGKGMSVAFADYDHDGFVDIFVTNDTEPNFLFHNLGNRRFEEAGLEAGVALTADGKTVSAMGADFRDYDNDGLEDLIFTALAGETFPVFRNQGGGVFQDTTYASQVGRLSARLSGWSIGLFDFNNDGWKDLFTANAHVTDNIEQFSSDTYRQPNAVWANTGSGGFKDASAASGPDFQTPRAHRGGAFADFNNDGKIDVVVTSLGEAAELWENVSPGQAHWLRLRLEGATSNRDGIGARITIGDQHNQMTTAVGYASSSHAGVHFGLGETRVIPKIEILWPSGVTQVLEQVEADRVLRVKEPSATP